MRNIAMRRRKTEKSSTDDESLEEKELKRQLSAAEDRFRKLLSPIEAYIMGFQSTLVWEIPSFSACVMIAVNILFWLATRTRFYHLLGMTGLVVVFVDIWIHKIWPEIRVPPPPNEDEEGWTPVHPKLLSVPELSRHLAGLWITTSTTFKWLRLLRKRRHAKFFVVMMVFLVGVGIVGLYVSGITLLYFTVMSFFIIPPIIYYNLYEQVYAKIEPTVRRVEKAFNVKRTRSRKNQSMNGRSLLVQTTNLGPLSAKLEELFCAKKKDGGAGAGGVTAISDSDEELQEFVPQGDAAKPALMKATQESEEESSGHTPGLLTPDAISQGPSRDISDTDSLGDNETSVSFTKGLQAIPDFDDSRLDDSFGDNDKDLTIPIDDVTEIDDTSEFAESVLPEDDIPTHSEISQSDSMQFVTGHFKESSESDIETDLAEGLAFPDIQDELDSMAAEESSSNTAIATEMVSKTVSSLMASTISGWSKLSETATRVSETVLSAAKSATGSRAEPTATPPVITFTKSDDGEEVTAIEGATGGALPKTIMESTDSDILAEFEFLDQEDLDVTDEEDSLEISPHPSGGRNGDNTQDGAAST